MTKKEKWSRDRGIVQFYDRSNHIPETTEHTGMKRERENTLLPSGCTQLSQQVSCYRVLVLVLLRRREDADHMVYG